MKKCTVDAAMCGGHGRCFDILPEHFDVDDDGCTVMRGKIWEVPDELVPRVEEAILGCPEVAIKWID